MGTISHTRVVKGASSIGKLTGAGRSGSVDLGETQTAVDYPDADIFYTFKISDTDVLDNLELDIRSGVVSILNGDPTVEGGDGNDFEGAMLPTMNTLYAMIWRLEEVGDGIASINGETFAIPAFDMIAEGHTVSVIYGDGYTTSPTKKKVALTCYGSNQVLTCTMVGKST